MRTELVNTLLKAGIIDEGAIAHAEEHTLGSSLIERLLDLGYGSEQDVYKIIKNKLNLAVVSSDDLMNIPLDAIKLIPMGMVERHHFLPLHADSANLHIAVFDPTQDACLNELSFFTHLRVVPYGALASDLTKALNKYFELGLPEEFRHKKSAKPKLPDGLPDLPPPPVPDFPIPGKKTGDIELPPLPNINKKGPEIPEAPELPEIPKMPEVQEIPEAQAAPEVQAMPEMPDTKISELVEVPDTEVSSSRSVTMDDIGVFDVSDDGGDFTDISNSKIDLNFSTVPIAQEDDEKEIIGQRIIATGPIDVTLITKAVDKEEAIQSTIRTLETFNPCALLLFVKNDDMVAIGGFGEHIEGNMEDYKVSLSAPNMFQWVFENKKAYIGKPQGGYINDMFFKHFGGFVPEEIAIVPVLIEGEVVAAIYSEDPASAEGLKEVADAVAKVFDHFLDAI